MITFVFRGSTPFEIVVLKGAILVAVNCRFELDANPETGVCEKAPCALGVKPLTGLGANPETAPGVNPLMVPRPGGAETGLPVVWAKVVIAVERTRAKQK